MSLVALSLIYSGVLVALSRSWLGDVKTWIENAATGVTSSAAAPANTPGGKGKSFETAPGVGNGGGGGGGGTW